MAVSLLITSAPFCTFTLATPALVTPVQLRSPHSLLRTKQVQRALIGQCMNGYHSRVAVCMSRKYSVDAAVQHCKGRTLDTQYTRVCSDCCRAKHGNHPPIGHRAKKAASFVHGTLLFILLLPCRGHLVPVFRCPLSIPTHASHQSPMLTRRPHWILLVHRTAGERPHPVARKQLTVICPWTSPQSSCWNRNRIRRRRVLSASWACSAAAPPRCD